MSASEDNTHERTSSGQVPASGRIATITLGVDGRLYFHDLPPEFLEVAAEICPTAPAVTERLRLARVYPRVKNECGNHEVIE